MGFDGVIMTDDMDNMGGVSGPCPKKRPFEGCKAGNDLILSSTYASQIPYVLQAIEDGEYSEEDLNAAAPGS